MGRPGNEFREEASGLLSAGRPVERERVIAPPDQNIIHSTIQIVCRRDLMPAIAVSVGERDNRERLVQSRQEHSGLGVSAAGRQGKSIEQIVFIGNQRGACRPIQRARLMLQRGGAHKVLSEIGTIGPQCRDVTPQRRETAIPRPQDFADGVAPPDRALGPPDLSLQLGPELSYDLIDS